MIFAFDKCEFSETRICQMRVRQISDEKKKAKILYFSRVKLAFVKCEFHETRICADFSFFFFSISDAIIFFRLC